MPVIEMRESLGNIDVEIIGSGTNKQVAVVQKRINLKEGPYQRNMLQMDLFFDDFPHVIGSTPTIFPRPFDGVIEFFLSPTPIILKNESIQLAPNRGPDAANSNILYKAIIQTQDERATAGQATTILTPLVTRFPQDFLATNANFPFFHDQLYLTMVFHAYDNDVYPFPYYVRFAASLYMSYHEKKVKASRSAMGVISERFNSMIALQESNGRVLQRPNELAGQFMPAYTWGGIRPEYMVTADNLSQFFLKRDGQEPELMLSTTSLRNFVLSARQMVPNPEPFGRASTAPVGDVPDWFRTLIPAGIIAGPIRDQFPPKVTQDDPTQPGLGNILMV